MSQGESENIGIFYLVADIDDINVWEVRKISILWLKLNHMTKIKD